MRCIKRSIVLSNTTPPQHTPISGAHLKKKKKNCAVRESDRQRGLCNSRGEARSQGGNNLTVTMEHWAADLLPDALSFTFPIALKDSGVFMMMSSLLKHWI